VESEDGSGLEAPATGTVERVRASFHLLLEGHLNPWIFMPAWFAREGIVRDEEASKASATLTTSPSVLAFRTDDFSFLATAESVEIYSSNEGLEPILRDLLLNMFTLLRHTPLSTLTVSRSVHLAGESGPAFDVVTPYWPALLPIAPFEQVLSEPSVAGISVEGVSSDIADCEIALSLQPSQRSDASLFIECRYRFALSSDQASGAGALDDILKNRLSVTRSHSESVCGYFSQHLLGYQLT